MLKIGNLKKALVSWFVFNGVVIAGIMFLIFTSRWPEGASVTSQIVLFATLSALSLLLSVIIKAVITKRNESNQN